MPCVDESIFSSNCQSYSYAPSPRAFLLFHMSWALISALIATLTMMATMAAIHAQQLQSAGIYFPVERPSASVALNEAISAPSMGGSSRWRRFVDPQHMDASSDYVLSLRGPSATRDPHLTMHLMQVESTFDFELISAAAPWSPRIQPALLYRKTPFTYVQQGTLITIRTGVGSLLMFEGGLVGSLNGRDAVENGL